MSSLDPLVCCRCEQPYTFTRRLVTRSCGHSFCETCENQIGLACAVCPLSGTRVPALDIATLVCAGCGEHSRLGIVSFPLRKCACWPCVSLTHCKFRRSSEL